MKTSTLTTDSVEISAILGKDMKHLELENANLGGFLLYSDGGGVPATIKDDGEIVYGDEIEPFRMVIKEISLDSFITTAERLPIMIVDPGLNLTRKQVLAIADACTQRLKIMDQNRRERDELLARHKQRREVAA